MDYNKEKLADTLEKLEKMSPVERVKHLEGVATEIKKEMQESEQFLKQSQELLERNKNEMLKQAINQEQKALSEREERKRTEERGELSRFLFEQEEKEKQNLENSVRNTRLPSTHPIVNLYNQLQQVRYTYREDTATMDYNQTTTILEGIRRDVIELLSQYKEVPEEMKEIASATYRLTKDLLGEAAANRRYIP